MLPLQGGLEGRSPSKIFGMGATERRAMLPLQGGLEGRSPSKIFIIWLVTATYVAVTSQ